VSRRLFLGGKGFVKRVRAGGAEHHCAMKKYNFLIICVALFLVAMAFTFVSGMRRDKALKALAAGEGTVEPITSIIVVSNWMFLMHGNAAIRVDLDPKVKLRVYGEPTVEIGDDGLWVVKLPGINTP